MNIQPAPSRTPALETDKSGVFNRIWVRWFDTLKSVIEGLQTSASAITTDHRKLTYLNSADYTHLTAANATDLTDGGVTTLHSHASDHVAATVVDTTTVDMSITGQQISAVTIGLNDTITFVE